MKFLAVNQEANQEANQILRRAGVTLALFVATFAAVERAEAACTPATSPGAVVNGQTVDCTGPTSGQNGGIGWGTGAESAVTINVEAGASVTGANGGLNVNDGTVNNLGGGSVIEATAAGSAVRAEGGALTVTNSAGGTIRANGVSGFGINGVGDVTLTNTGLIEATNITAGSNSMAIVANAFATVTNNIGGVIVGGLKGISAGTIKVLGNDGTIEASAAGGNALFAGDVTVNNNATGTIRANNTSGTAISGNTINVTGNSGLIEATGPGGIAISANISATVANGSGSISGASRGITGTTINVTGNAGTIEATAAGGIAIQGNSVVNNSGGTIRANGSDGAAIFGTTINVNGNSGLIEATGTNGVAILATTAATVNNLSGGTISGGKFGIFTNPGATLDVTNGAGATISGGINGINGSGTVRNAGTITGGNQSVSFHGSGTNTLILQSGSVLNGLAQGDSTATNKLILQGSGTANNDFGGFTSLDMASGNSFWVLNGNSGVGAATISGILEVGDGAHASAKLTGNVTVNSGGQLVGQGTISGDVNVMSGGLLAPGAVAGTAIGTLTVTGNAAFAANSTFSVSANAAGQASKLAVGGTATLTDARVQVLAQSGTFAPSTQYTILTAAGGLGGTTFGSITSDLAFLTPSLSYTANNVMLTLACTNPTACSDGGTGGTTGAGTVTTGFGFASAAQTRNRTAVATALDAGPITNPLILAVLSQTFDGARQAFDALSGEVFGSLHNTQGQEAQFARSAMLGRMRQASYAGAPGELGALGFAGPQLAYASADANGFPVKAAPAQGPSRDLTFWAQGLGGWGKADSDGNAASLKSRFGGFLSGVDARFGETWRAGWWQAICAPIST